MDDLLFVKSQVFGSDCYNNLLKVLDLFSLNSAVLRTAQLMVISGSLDLYIINYVQKTRAFFEYFKTQFDILNSILVKIIDNPQQFPTLLLVWKEISMALTVLIVENFNPGLISQLNEIVRR